MTRGEQRIATHARRKAGVAKREATKRKDGFGSKRAAIAKLTSEMKPAEERADKGATEMVQSGG